MMARRGLAVLCALASAASAASVVAAPISSDWFQGFDNKARLIAGRVEEGGKDRLYAGIEIAMPEGFKTYWRAPGDAGGVPPEFDWRGSDNLASAEVLYPAPHRLHDKAGDAIGYKNGVIFAVRLKAKDAAQPVTLHGRIAYGVCKDICIPAEADLKIVVPPGAEPSQELAETLAKVPRREARPGVDPVLQSWRLDTSSGKPKLVLDVASADSASADVFVDVPGGIYVPLPKRAADAGGNAVFEVDLTDGVALKDLKGKPLSVTMVDAKGQSETTITLE